MTRLEWFISEEYSTHRPTPYERIVDRLESVEDVIFNLDTLQHIVAANLRLKCVDGRPIAPERVEMALAEIKAFYKWVQEFISGLPAGFVSNANETGYQEWANRTVQRVVALVSHLDEVIEIPSNWSSKHALIPICIAAEGTLLKPMGSCKEARLSSSCLRSGTHPTNSNLRIKNVASLMDSYFSIRRRTFLLRKC
jgi:hypothetical protein